MKNKIKIQTAVGVVIGTLIGFGIYAYKQKKLLEALCYEISAVKFLGSKDGVSNFGIMIKFSNYSDLTINVNGYKINAYVDDTLLAVSEMSGQSYQLLPKSSSVISFEAKTKTAQTIGDLLGRTIDGLLSQSESRFKIIGTLDVKAGWIRVKDYPIDLQWTAQEVIDDIKDEETCPAIT